MSANSNEDIIQIPVRMGSNCFTIEVEESRTQKLTGYELIEMALTKCKLNGQLANTYHIYERANGVDQMLSRKANVLQLWKKFTATPEVSVEIVVRKMSSMEKRLVAKGASNQSVARKCFKKLNQLNEVDANNHQKDDEKMKYLKRIVRNEIRLQKQSMKLIEMEKSISERLQQVEHKLDSMNENGNREKPALSEKHMQPSENNLKLRRNTNIIKSLIRKLKSSSLSHSKGANSISRTHLLSNSCGNSSDDESFDKKTNSRTSSTSTLESLV